MYHINEIMIFDISFFTKDDKQEAQWACIAHLVFRTLFIKF